MRTLVDTTSLIALATYDDNPKELVGYHWRDEEEEYVTRNLTPGIEALILYDNVLVDAGSFRRNSVQRPSLKNLNDVVTFVNETDAVESNSYHFAATVLAPLLVHPGPWLVDALLRHIDPLDTCELTVGNIRFAPSTYWGHISVKLSGSEKTLVSALERTLGSFTPFSGAALANLVRLFYYLVVQESYQCSISLNPMKATFLDGIPGWGGTVSHIPKTILDAFDGELKNEYLATQKKWLGEGGLTFEAPMLFDYVFKRTAREGGLIQSILAVRDSYEAKQFRAGVDALAGTIENSSRREIISIVSDLDRQTKAWQDKLRISLKRKKRQIKIDIPFIRGLGGRIASLVPKYVSSPSDQIFSFFTCHLRMTSEFLKKNW